jgi:hypothetical protein
MQQPATGCASSAAIANSGYELTRWWSGALEKAEAEEEEGDGSSGVAPEAGTDTTRHDTRPVRHRLGEEMTAVPL